MLSFIKKFKIRSLITFVISLLDLLFFISMRPLYSGIGKVVGSQALPIIVLVLVFLTFISTVILMAFKKEGFYIYIIMGLSICYIGAFIAVISMGGASYLRYVMRHFSYLLLGTLLLFAMIYLFVFYPKTKLYHNKLVNILAVSLLAISITLPALNVRVNIITLKPVVYAVENTYQIVFSTSAKGDGRVKVGDKFYSDTFAGSDNTDTYIHKVSVPMDTLDNCKEYTVLSQAMLYRGPFGGFKGAEVSYTSKFRPVDTSDGIQYTALSDVHDALNSASKVGGYFDEKLDFLVLAGDLVSMVDDYSDADFASRLAYKITKGERPVIYARGNHEIKSKEAKNLYKYVGAKGEDFFYYFRMKDIFGIVLDLGEDHEDDWWEYYGTARFDEYRNRQLEFLKTLDEKMSGSKFRMVVSHIPLVHINYRKNFLEFKKQATTILNTMNIDIHLTGHQHQLVPFVPFSYEPYTKLVRKDGYEGYFLGGQLTDFNFLSMMVGKRSMTQKADADEFVTSHYTGMASNVDLTAKKETCFYINSDKEIVPVADMYRGTPIQDEFVYTLKNI